MKYNPQIHHRRSIRLQDYDYSSEGAYFVTMCTQNRECLFGEIVNGQMILNEHGKIVEQCWNDLPNHYDNIELDAYVIMPNHFHGIIFINDTIDTVDNIGAIDVGAIPVGAIPVGAIHESPNVGAIPESPNVGAIHVGAIHESPQQPDNESPNVGAIHESPQQPDNESPNVGAIPVGAIHESPRQRRKMLLPKIIGRFKMNSAKQINQIRNTSGVPVWQRNYYEQIIRNEKSLEKIRNYIINNPLEWYYDDYNPKKVNYEKQL